MLTVRKAKVLATYQVSPVCPKCNSDMVRSTNDDISNMKEIIKNHQSSENLKYTYAYRCISCGHLEYSDHSYPHQIITMDLANAEYKPEEEYYRDNAN